MTPAVIVASSESPIANGTEISATAVINSSAACSAYETLPLNIAYPRYVRKREMCVSGVTEGPVRYESRRKTLARVRDGTSEIRVSRRLPITGTSPS